jgi:hypothetical protein
MGFRHLVISLVLAACVSPVVQPHPDAPEAVRHPMPPPAETVLDPARHPSGEYRMDPGTRQLRGVCAIWGCQCTLRASIESPAT